MTQKPKSHKYAKNSQHRIIFMDLRNMKQICIS